MTPLPRLADDLVIAVSRASNDSIFACLSSPWSTSGEVLRRSIESTQYASVDYRDALTKHAMVQSMSRKGDCWDNAVAESFFATLEHELLAGNVFASHREANAALFDFIEQWYNTERQHSTLQYQSPQQYEQQLRRMARAA